MSVGSSDAMPDRQMVTAESGEERHCKRIAVVSEPGRSGAATLARAAELAAAASAHLTVVAIAPQTATSCRSCGGVSPNVYIRAVRDDIAHDLGYAAARLDLDPDNINVELLIKGLDPPLAN